jgi:type I restriction enzyme M protein
MAEEKERYTLVLANPPFAGALDYESTAKDLQRIVKTRKTELLFLALFLRLLKTGGRAAVIVPDGVLFGSSMAHKAIRRALVEEHRLEAVIKLPSGVFRPYAGVSTAILLFTKTGVGGTEEVWFYDVQADGWSLDDKRVALLPEEKLGPTLNMGQDERHSVPSPLVGEGQGGGDSRVSKAGSPPTPSLSPQGGGGSARHPAALSAADHAKNNLPDVLARWNARDKEKKRARTERSFLVPKADIAAAGYDLSLNRYKEVVHDEVAHRAPREIITELKALEGEIAEGLAELEGIVG